MNRKVSLSLGIFALTAFTAVSNDVAIAAGPSPEPYLELSSGRGALEKTDYGTSFYVQYRVPANAPSNAVVVLPSKTKWRMDSSVEAPNHHVRVEGTQKGSEYLQVTGRTIELMDRANLTGKSITLDASEGVFAGRTAKATAKDSLDVNGEHILGGTFTAPDLSVNANGGVDRGRIENSFLKSKDLWLHASSITNSTIKAGGKSKNYPDSKAAAVDITAESLCGSIFSGKFDPNYFSVTDFELNDLNPPLNRRIACN